MWISTIVSYIVSINHCDETFEYFVKLNPQVKSFTISDSKGQFDRLIESVHQFPELAELKLNLSMEVQPKELNKLAHLQQLKVFSFNCMWVQLAELLESFVEQNVALEELDLRHITLDQNVAENLAKFSRMKKLRLFDGQVKNGVLPNALKGMLQLEKLYLSGIECVRMNDIKGIVKNAPVLNELHLDQNSYRMGWEEEVEDFIINRSDFNEICQCIKERSEGIKLNLNVSGIRCKLDVPQNIIEISKCWLEVRIITYKDVEPIDIIDYYGVEGDIGDEATDGDSEMDVSDRSSHEDRDEKSDSDWSMSS